MTPAASRWLDGALVGQVTQIMRSANNRIMYMTASDAMPQIGNEAYIYPGCDKTPQTCKDKFNNFNRNRATPYVPLKESIR
ncbi:MAG: phage BR0599 family protein [Veillonella sp.]|uniref:phage BR0599 family protein n=1 Tax=Veillonella sp. TaxID=1926307 RepID=UPI0039A206BB